MNIVFTGGGSGGHFYPLMAVAETLRRDYDEEKPLELYYIAPDPYDRDELNRLDITYRRVTAGKMRRYFSLKNIIDPFKTAWGICVALWRLFFIYPDVVFAKGAYGSFPVLLAARLLFIPVFIHESDSTPGRTNKWAGKFAKRIAVSYASAAEYFDSEKVAHTGQPIRPALTEPLEKEESREYFSLPDEKPVVLVLGGSQGAQIINDTVIEALPTLLERYSIIHQVGAQNLANMSETVRVMHKDLDGIDRYQIRGHMDNTELRAAAGTADIVISRAGSTIFEIAVWALPSIVIPITSSNGDHQRSNAYQYARAGAASVIEESNFSANILTAELYRILNDQDTYTSMTEATKEFVTPDAAATIAEEIHRLAAKHYS